MVDARHSAAQFSSFVTGSVELTASSMSAYAHDDEARVDLSLELEITGSGLVRTSASVMNLSVLVFVSACF